MSLSLPEVVSLFKVMLVIKILKDRKQNRDIFARGD